MPKKTEPIAEIISGVCQQLLFSPEGWIEGALIKTKGTVAQLVMDPETGESFANASGPGKRVRALATRDESPRAADGAHPVYEFEAFADALGNAIVPTLEDMQGARLKGVVASLHFARHGQPNGVVLETGEFIHMRPHGMELLELGVGSKVDAIGELRTTTLGTKMLEAHRVNKVELA